MLDTGSNLLNVIVAIFIYSWIIAILYGVIVAISYPIFTKTNTQSSGVFVPIYNLFELCSLNGYDDKSALLFLVPGINIIMMMLMSYKLKELFNTSSSFNIGLLILPPIFMPMLAYSNVGVEEEEETPIEVEKVIPQEEPNDIDVDSIFKTPSQVQQVDNKPYKAKKVQVNQKFINSAPAEQEKVEKLDI